MDAQAIIFEKPGKLAIDTVALTNPGIGDVVVESRFSGISTGTERLLWEGRMPDFPGMGYPLVPGYETVGEVVEDRSGAYKVGQLVFVPGSSAYSDVRGLFGGTASRLVVQSERVSPVEFCRPQEGTLLALAATAHHALVGRGVLPELVIGNGVLGQLIARMIVALGGKSPTIWEKNPIRRASSGEFNVIDPSEHKDVTYQAVIDVSGDSTIVDALAPVLKRGGEITLAGFYADRINFSFPPVFMKEAQIRVAAEWQPSDLAAVQELLAKQKMHLENLISHERSAEDAEVAYKTAFGDPQCLKMVLDWEGRA